MRRLGEIGVPLPLAASAEQAVEKFFSRTSAAPRGCIAGHISDVEEQEHEFSLHGMER